VGPATNALTAPGAAVATNPAAKAATGEGKKANDKPIFVSSAFALVGGRRFALGDDVGGQHIRRILRDGVEFEGGEQSRWAVLLRSGQGPGNGPVRSDQ
jgi:hypothetical protein